MSKKSGELLMTKRCLRGLRRPSFIGPSLGVPRPMPDPVSSLGRTQGSINPPAGEPGGGRVLIAPRDQCRRDVAHVKGEARPPADGEHQEESDGPTNAHRLARILKLLRTELLEVTPSQSKPRGRPAIVTGSPRSAAVRRSSPQAGICGGWAVVLFSPAPPS